MKNPLLPACPASPAAITNHYAITTKSHMNYPP